MSDDSRSFLPLTPALFHVLVSLADSDRHGYAIIKDIAARTDGAVELGTGTLYGIIKRLLADALVVETRAPVRNDDPRRRYYRLTPLGRAVAQAEADRLERTLDAARATTLFRKARTT
jgi:DNA-binding PadR family transcriptional regulator